MVKLGQEMSWRERTRFCPQLQWTALSSSSFSHAHPRNKHSTMASTEQTDAPDYVTLVSNDGFEFLVQRKSACLSGAIKRMLDPNSAFVQPSFFDHHTDCGFQMALQSQRRTSVSSRTSTVWCSRRCASTSTTMRRTVTRLVLPISTFRLSSVLSCSWRLTT